MTYQTQFSDSPPPYFTTQLWPSTDTIVTTNDLWVSTRQPITIWSGLEVVASWWDPFAKPRMIPGACVPVRYTLGPTQTQESNDVVVYHAGAQFVTTELVPPAPPASLGNRVNPGGATLTVSVSPPVTATADWTRSPSLSTFSVTFTYNSSMATWTAPGSPSIPAGAGLGIAIDSLSAQYHPTGDNFSGLPSETAVDCYLYWNFNSPGSVPFSAFLGGNLTATNVYPGGYYNTDVPLDIRSQWLSSTWDSTSIQSGASLTTSQLNGLWFVPHHQTISLYLSSVAINYGAAYYVDGDTVTLNLSYYVVNSGPETDLVTNPTIVTPYLEYGTSGYPGLAAYNLP